MPTQNILELDRDYSIIEIQNLNDFVIVACVIIDHIYHKVTPTHIANRRNTNLYVMSYSEIITIISLNSTKYLVAQHIKLYWPSDNQYGNSSSSYFEFQPCQGFW